MPSEGPPPPPPPPPPAGGRRHDGPDHAAAPPGDRPAGAGADEPPTTSASPDTSTPTDTPASPDTSTVDDLSVPRRLHPASVLLGVNAAQAVQAFLFPAFASFAAGGAIAVGFVGVFLLGALIVRVLAWQRFLFSFDGEVVRVESGVLSRNHRSVDVARIQQVEIQRGVIQRALGLAALSIETAGGSGATEVELRVMPDADAVALRAAVRASKARLEGRTTSETGAEQDDGDDTEHVLTVPMKHVVLAAVTGAQLLVFPAVVGGAFQFIGQQVGQFIDQTTELLIERGVADPGDLVGAPGWQLVLTVVAAALVLSVAFAIAVGVFRDGRFRIVRRGEDLHVTRGLVSTRDSVVPLRRVQLVEIRRNWLRRPLGYASVRIHSAGGSAGVDRRVTVPLLPEAEVPALLRQLLPGVEGLPTLTSHPPAALRRALFRWLRPAALVVATVWLVLPRLPVTFLVDATETARWIVLALLPINAVLAVIEYRQLGHALTERIVVSRRGALSITTTLSPVVKVQAVTTVANWFQRRLGIASLAAHVAGPGGNVEVLDAGREDADRLHARLTEHAASPTAVGPDVDEADDAPVLTG